MRSVRRDALADIKEMLKEKLIAQDDDRRAQDDIQKLTDKHVAEIAACHALAASAFFLSSETRLAQDAYLREVGKQLGATSEKKCKDAIIKNGRCKYSVKRTKQIA